jgi:hypothetical protein
VVLASTIVAVLAVNHLVMRVIPALFALDPFGLLQLAAVVVCMSLVWGFLTLRPWAWTTGAILSGIGCLLPILLMQDLDALQLQTGLAHHTLVIQFLLFVEFAAFSVFVLLMQDSSKAAFHK